MPRGKVFGGCSSLVVFRAVDESIQHTAKGSHRVDLGSNQILLADEFDFLQVHRNRFWSGNANLDTRWPNLHDLDFDVFANEDRFSSASPHHEHAAPLIGSFS